MTRGCSLAILATIATFAADAQIDDPQEPLCRAAWAGDVAQVRALLARGTNPNVRDEQNFTPLMRAAAAHGRSTLDISTSTSDKNALPDYVGVAKLLLAKGADVNARGPKNSTALLLAMQGSASEYKVVGADDGMARLLVGRGANVNGHDDEGWTPLLEVLNLWANQAPLTAFLLAKGADVNARLNDGRSGLMLAARLGKDDRLAPLIAKGADVNARDKSGATALMVAATIQWSEQSLTMMQFLVSKRANLNATDYDGRTAADRAAQAGYPDRAKFLIASGTKIADANAFMKRARNYALLRAVISRDTAAAKTMLDEGADPDFRDETGRTLLMLAADDEYSAERTILLLEHGASVNLRGTNGDTALMVAADRYQPDIVQALLDRGADPNAVDREGNSILMRAAGSKYGWQEERKPLVHFILDHDADVGHKNAHGMTALMLMAREGNPGLQLLLDNGADVNARDEEGNTALLHAARFFTRGWPRRNGWAMLEKGADVNAANQKGETALILAATQSEPDAARLLLQKGADVNFKTKSGRTALMQAIDGPKEFDNEKHGVYSPAIAKLLIEVGADVDTKDNDGNTALSIARKRGYYDIAAVLEHAGAKP